MNQKPPDYTHSTFGNMQAAKAIRKIKISSYETIGDLFDDLQPLINLEGVELPRFSKETELKTENEKLKKELEQLKKPPEKKGK